MERSLDYGDESGSSDDSIDMHEITFKMPDKFKDSQSYLLTIWKMMELEHKDINNQRMYRIKQEIENEYFKSTFY